MIKHYLLLSLLLISTNVASQTSKPHFAAKPADKGELQRSVVRSQSAVSSDKPPKEQGEKVYHYRNQAGSLVFSDYAPQQGHYQVLLFDCYACQPESTINWQSIPLFTSLYKEQIALAASTYQLEPALIRAVIHAESAFKVAAVSKAGAQGLMQLMPETAKELGVNDVFHPQQNISAGSRYLAQLLKRFDGDIALACAAYNAGASRVEQYKGVPPFSETQAYVERVQILLKRYRSS
ncbi:lytic transglycosylase domain-containing protein [Shewanella fidelis]|uniref:lytic transglycosylase domain-containing protein n=1 Tax=Shewanella fidelis TaxID=173509 RepID=UPI00048A8CC7|nr:lytic transglycosylase domain-containing protein [Shewanella fidelis]